MGFKMCIDQASVRKCRRFQSRGATSQACLTHTDGPCKALYVKLHFEINPKSDQWREELDLCVSFELQQLAFK